MNFEQWWQNTYAEKLGAKIIEESFKEVAKAAWDEQQRKIDDIHGVKQYCEKYANKMKRSSAPEYPPATPKELRTNSRGF